MYFYQFDISKAFNSSEVVLFILLRKSFTLTNKNYISKEIIQYFLRNLHLKISNSLWFSCRHIKLKEINTVWHYSKIQSRNYNYIYVVNRIYVYLFFKEKYVWRRWSNRFKGKTVIFSLLKSNIFCLPDIFNKNISHQLLTRNRFETFV